MKLQLSVLDPSPVDAGSTAADALRNTIERARLADRLGYTRYWLAEHHNTPGIASSAPEIIIGEIARVTVNMRVGSGGIMLPNHAPLKVAEVFQTLAALYPGRLDLGIGRAPGTDQDTALALRRSDDALSADDFPEQLADLTAFSTGRFPTGHRFRSVQAVPAGVALPPIWLLGSSGYSAELAAALGLGFAHAYHISPYGAVESMQAYRAGFRPSAQFPQPQAIITAPVVCAETDAQAEYLAASVLLRWVQLSGGHLGPVLSPDEAQAYSFTPQERSRALTYRSRLFVGSAATVHSGLLRLAVQTGTAEVMVVTTVYGHAQRARCLELLAAACELDRS